jgi:hypothetical protein
MNTTVEISFLFETFWFLADLSASYFAFWSGVFSISIHLLWLHLWTQVMSYVYETPNKTPLTEFKGITVPSIIGNDTLDHGYIVSKESRIQLARSWVLNGSQNLRARFYILKYLNATHESKLAPHKTQQQLYKHLYHSLKLIGFIQKDNSIPFSFFSQKYRTTLSILDLQLFKTNQLDTFFNLTLNFTDKLTAVPNLTLEEKSTNFEWNLHHFGNELAQAEFSDEDIEWMHGPFYLFNQDFTKLNKFSLMNSEYVNFSEALTDQLNILKWSRWLYRYNVLHRKLIDNSHRITNTKKLLSSGFYDSRLMSHNLWASHFFNQKNNKNLLKTQTQSLYNDVFNLNKRVDINYRSLGVNSSNKSLSHLSFYEKSFFFFVHRFQSLNRMVNLNISSNHTVKKVVDNKTRNGVSQTIYTNRQLLNTASKSIKASYDDFYFLQNNIDTSNLLNMTKASNSKSIWKEEESTSMFNLDISNLCTNLSELSDLTPKGVLTYDYTQYKKRKTLSGPFQWTQHGTQRKQRLNNNGTLNSRLINDLVLQSTYGLKND